MELLSDPQVWLSFATLAVLEIVLGIDNVIFLSILVARLPHEKQHRARIMGLGLAMLTRIGLLFSITWLISLTRPLWTIAGEELSGRDLILLAGGLFLLVKSVLEIHAGLEGPEERPSTVRGSTLFVGVILQIAVIDIVFSLDSVFTAVGLSNHIEVMVSAIVLAVLVMMFVARPINEFIERHPTIKMLALAFLILVGVALIAEGLDMHIPRGYLYFAMAFSFAVEMINIRMRKKYLPPVDLRGPHLPPADEGEREQRRDS
jgi:predicted tellurium resistance membrane protein TerC